MTAWALRLPGPAALRTTAAASLASAPWPALASVNHPLPEGVDPGDVVVSGSGMASAALGVAAPLGERQRRAFHRPYVRIFTHHLAQSSLLPSPPFCHPQSSWALALTTCSSLARMRPVSSPPLRAKRCAERSSTMVSRAVSSPIARVGSALPKVAASVCRRRAGKGSHRLTPYTPHWSVGSYAHGHAHGVRRQPREDRMTGESGM